PLSRHRATRTRHCSSRSLFPITISISKSRSLGKPIKVLKMGGLDAYAESRMQQPQAKRGPNDSGQRNRHGRQKLKSGK
ncbi:hypothetical protein, partial [Rugamonas sp.]|uniref:hypothetical protein n=1 Tax=Rugamonas sp. TaxID=1926287 RepID=UPI0025EC7645